MEQGPYEEKLLQDAFRSGMPIPIKIINAPELRLGLQLFMNGFVELSSSRQSGFGVSPIPWHVIHEYCERLGLDEDQREDMLYHVQEMDKVYMQKKQA